MVQLVADIHSLNIGSLYWQKQLGHAPCGILKMSVNGVSTSIVMHMWQLRHRTDHSIHTGIIDHPDRPKYDSSKVKH